MKVSYKDTLLLPQVTTLITLEGIPACSANCKEEGVFCKGGVFYEGSVVKKE